MSESFSAVQLFNPAYQRQQYKTNCIKKSNKSAYFIHFYEPASKNSYCFGFDNDRRKK